MNDDDERRDRRVENVIVFTLLALVSAFLTFALLQRHGCLAP